MTMEYKNEMEQLCGMFTDSEKEKIMSAFGLAMKSVEGMKRGNDRPFIEHPIGVVRILVDEVGLGADSVTAYLLHEATRFDKGLFANAEKDYGSRIAGMADSLNKISAIRPKDTRLEAENYRKLIISYSSDPRVVLIKLADRLEVMRNLDLLPKQSRERKNTETLMLYIPLAHQLGLYRLKSEMENLYFKYSDIVHYREITNKLKATERSRQNLVTAFINPLKDKLTACGIKYELKARTKTAYSIWKKMQAQSVPFEGVYDVFAIRFIIDSPPDHDTEKDLCWRVYSLVTEEYEPDVSRLRDWLSKPKPNGYESLHTTVKNKEGEAIEVQIRTRRMDDIAENGFAAHWAYKGIKRAKSMDEWLASVKKLLENPDPSVSGTAIKSIDDVLVYTPAGDLRRLPKGACVLDFAFEIHSNLGLKCCGAKVNGRIMSIRELLHTGDVVEIMQNKNQKPAADWLNFVVTPKAKAKIRQKLNEEESKHAAAGRELLQRRLKNWKKEVDDDLMNEICKRFGYKTSTDFLSALGTESFDIADLKEFLDEYFSSEEDASRHDAPENAESGGHGNEDIQGGNGSGDGYITIGKLNDIGYSFAKCCNPIYGDDVFAFVTRNGGVKIHRMSCPNAARLIENYPYRIQMVKWKDTAPAANFQVNLKIVAEDELTNGQYILDEAGKHGVSIRSFSMEDHYSGKTKSGTVVKMQVSVKSNQHLDRFVSGLKKLDGVKNVVRVKQS